MKRKNVSIQLNSIGPTEIAIASVLDLFVEWMLEGQSSNILKEAEKYSAVLLKHGVQVSRVKNFSNPVAIINTRTEDRVLMTILTEQPTSPFEVFELACKLVKNQESDEAAGSFEGVKFPMIDLDVQINVDWLRGMMTDGWNVGQALQETKLKMNEKGAHIREAVAIAAEASAPGEEPQPLVIDEPFLLVFQRPSLRLPLFSAFLAEECWKNPGSLDM